MTILRTLDEQAERDREACEGKVRHGNKSQARAAARKGKSDYGRQLWFYQCPHCRGWHLTSKRPETRRHFQRLAREVEEK